MGRLMGTLGSGLLYTYVGDYVGRLAGSDAVAGLAACFLAGTICSFLAAIITTQIDDGKAGLKCGSCCTIVKAQQLEDDVEEEDGIIKDVETDGIIKDVEEDSIIKDVEEDGIIKETVSERSYEC